MHLFGQLNQVKHGESYLVSGGYGDSQKRERKSVCVCVRERERERERESARERERQRIGERKTFGFVILSY